MKMKLLNIIMLSSLLGIVIPAQAFVISDNGKMDEGVASVVCVKNNGSLNLVFQVKFENCDPITQLIRSNDVVMFWCKVHSEWAKMELIWPGYKKNWWDFPSTQIHRINHGRKCFENNSLTIHGLPGLTLKIYKGLR